MLQLEVFHSLMIRVHLHKKLNLYSEDVKSHNNNLTPKQKMMKQIYPIFSCKALTEIP